MTDGDRTELDVLAGEYVLGTLTGPPRVAFEAQLARDAALRARVRYWEDRLAPLATALPPVTPPATLWPAIERALDARDSRGAAPASLWSSLALWRGIAAASAALSAIVIAAALLLGPRAERDARQPAVAVLTDDARQAVWLALADAAGTRLELRAVKPIEPPAGRAFELWVIPAPGEIPRSLGLLAGAGGVIEPLPSGLKPGAVLAVSIEPSGGSPTGRATGPVVQVGTVVASGSP